MGKLRVLRQFYSPSARLTADRLRVEAEETSDLDGLLEDQLAAGESVVDVIDPAFLETPNDTGTGPGLSILNIQQSQKG